MFTKAGCMIDGIRYEIEYRCDTPGPEVDEGHITGQWTGEVDSWGKMTIVSDRGMKSYLFPREIIDLEEAEELPPRTKRLVLLIAEIEAEDDADLQATLDAFRENVIPKVEGITITRVQPREARLFDLEGFPWVQSIEGELD